MDVDTIKHNERFKGLATLADGVALAFLVAGGAEFYHAQTLDLNVGLAVIGTVISGLVGWHLRSYLRAE